MSPVRFALTNPHAVIVTALLFLVAGAVALVQISHRYFAAPSPFKSLASGHDLLFRPCPRAPWIGRSLSHRTELRAGDRRHQGRIEVGKPGSASFACTSATTSIRPAALAEVNSLANNTLAPCRRGHCPRLPALRPTATLPLAILSVSSHQSAIRRSAVAGPCPRRLAQSTRRHPRRGRSHRLRRRERASWFFRPTQRHARSRRLRSRCRQVVAELQRHARGRNDQTRR